LIVAATGPSVLIVDDDEVFRGALGRSFCALGCDTWVAHDFGAADLVLDRIQPELVVLEAQVGEQSALDFLARMQARDSVAEVVIVTAFPSTAGALQAIRAGAVGYLAKPVTAGLVLQALDRDLLVPSGEDAGPPKLSEAIRDYLDLAFATAGSMSETARRLGLERRSLRRMLRREPDR
jgi:two-component system, response regulator RegA